MTFMFQGTARITLEHTEGATKSKLVQTDFGLDVWGNLDQSKYVQPGTTIPNGKDGVKVLTGAFVQGLAGNIHAAHAAGYWDKADHLAYIKAELDRAFASDVQISEGTF